MQETGTGAGAGLGQMRLGWAAASSCCPLALDAGTLGSSGAPWIDAQGVGIQGQTETKQDTCKLFHDHPPKSLC
jgi:hypothetical protein